MLHQAAKSAFDEMNVKKLPKVKELQAEYAKLLEEKKKTYAEYRRSREEMRELLTAKANVDRLLKMDEEQKKEQEKDHGQRKLVLVISVRRTRSRRMKFCVQGGLGALPSTSKAEGKITAGFFPLRAECINTGIACHLIPGMFNRTQIWRPCD